MQSSLFSWSDLILAVPSLQTTLSFLSCNMLSLAFDRKLLLPLFKQGDGRNSSTHFLICPLPTPATSS